MIERYEFRMFPQYADLVRGFSANVLTASSSVAILRGVVGDAAFLKLGDIERDLRKSGLASTFAGWKITRAYTKSELQRAELFMLKVRFTHLSAEEHGTEYKESEVCRQEAFELEPISVDGQFELVPRMVPCGLCSRQGTPLQFPFMRLSQSKDIFRLWGGEVVVSERFRSLLSGCAFTGAELTPALHKGTARGKTSHLKTSRKLYQLGSRSQPVEISHGCNFGTDPFDSESRGSYRCSSGEIAGLQPLNSLKVMRNSWDGSDVCRTRIYVGGRQGLFRPHQLLLISNPLFRAMKRTGIRGFDVEIVEIA